MPTPPPAATGISVLVRTYNSAKSLDAVLRAVKRSDGDEFIVVDSGSTDTTLDLARAHQAHIVIAPGRFNYSKSLNCGFRAARHPWVLVLSSHSFSLVPDLLGVFRLAIAELPPEVAVAYGPNTLNGRGLFDDDKVRCYDGTKYEIIHDLCGNGNALYRKSAWEEMPFDETIRTGEDKAWMHAMLDRGRGIALVSGARTINRSQYSLRYMFMKGYSDQRVSAHHALSVFELAMGLASLTKQFLRGGMPVGNFVRYSAHNIGRFFGSRQTPDNTPYS